MKHKFILSTLFIAGSLFAQAQKKADTLIIKVGEGSKVIFAIQDKKDLETLKHYNFQSLMDDMITKLDKRDTAQIEKPASAYLKDTTKENSTNPETTVSTTEEWPTEADRKRYRYNNWSTDKYSRSYRRSSSNKRTYSSFNIDLGTNNYLSNGGFPNESNSIYSVRPWGSWYVALNSIQRTRLAKKFFLEWGAGVSWYNFKFQNDKTHLSKDDYGTYFNVDSRNLDFTKSKLTVVYLNASLVPMIDFGDNSRKSGLFSGRQSRSFRFGAGPYVGYRIDSYVKQVYEKDGDSKSEHYTDPFYLANIRYGTRVQFGFKSLDFFFNYDMNELFISNKGPQLNAFSFGISF